MEAQEIFDIVARHLLTQRKRSAQTVIENDTGEMCMYRGPGGLKCAAGVLMTDEEAAECGEEWAWSQDDLNPARRRVMSRIGHTSLVRELQYIHDHNHVSTWFDLLKGVARRADLDASVLDEFKEPNTEGATS